MMHRLTITKFPHDKVEDKDDTHDYFNVGNSQVTLYKELNNGLCIKALQFLRTKREKKLENIVDH